MADIGGPDKELLIAKHRVDISQQQTNIYAQEYRKKQLESEMRQIETNIEAAGKAFKDLNEKLNSLLTS